MWIITKQNTNKTCKMWKPLTLTPTVWSLYCGFVDPGYWKLLMLNSKTCVHWMWYWNIMKLFPPKIKDFLCISSCWLRVSSELSQISPNPQLVYLACFRQGHWCQPAVLRLSPTLAVRLGEDWLQRAWHCSLCRPTGHGGQAAAHNTCQEVWVPRWVGTLVGLL